MKPRISVVVPSFNQARYLREAIASILAQDYPRLELVVMDGGSTDGSIDIIKEFAGEIKYWRSAPDDGQAAAINEGMEHCQGDLVAWLNSDDYYLDDAFWAVARAYESYPDCGLYLGNGFRQADSTGRRTPFCPRHVAVSRAALAEGLDYILQPSAFILRKAWMRVGGLSADLGYGLDWDFFLRLVDKYPVVTINEFLSVSREYGGTKTASGEVSRALELVKLAQRQTRKQATLGSAYYLLESLLGVSDRDLFPGIKGPLWEAMRLLHEEMRPLWGAPDPFPVIADKRDRVYMPYSRFGKGRRPLESRPKTEGQLPSISLVIPSYNQVEYLGRCLESVLSQEYPNLELRVFDGGSDDGSVDLLRTYSPRLSGWESSRDKGPAEAINKGLRVATGDIVGWLNSDDMLAENALWLVARHFATHPSLQVLYGNAIYVDENDELAFADHGRHKTGLYYGQEQPELTVYKYWSYVHAIPQPTVYFRRDLLLSSGLLDKNYQFIFDFEFFWRLRQHAEFLKLEKSLAFYRLHSRSKTSSWTSFLVELYRFSRPQWPPVLSPEFPPVLRSYVLDYMHRRQLGGRKSLRSWVEAALIGLSVVSRIGNPEQRLARLGALRAGKGPSPLPPLPRHDQRGEVSYVIPEAEKTYSAVFCSFLWPRHPGYSGGEIRDFHLLRKLLARARIDFISIANTEQDGREDFLRPYVASVETPRDLLSRRPDILALSNLRRPLRTRAVAWFRDRKLPVLGPRYHADIAVFSPRIDAYIVSYLREFLAASPPDFLFVSPQLNPVALQLHGTPPRTRLIMASYDVEAVRISRMAEAHRGLARVAMMKEAERAASFEEDNLALFDGIIAVSEADRQVFIGRYGIESDRVLVVENGVDTDYFSFRPRVPTPQPNVVFVGSLAYWPNDQAARRLLNRIMPLVRAEIPNARAWIVGGGPERSLIRLADGEKAIVTGRVEDVRPYLDAASVCCIPLESGSGTKYKVLEALSAGAPVVCTPRALDGLDRVIAERHVEVGETDVEIARALIRTIRSPENRHREIEEAHGVIEDFYSWDKNLAKLETWLDRLLSMPKRQATRRDFAP